METKTSSYPRIPHLPGSPGGSPDDRRLVRAESLIDVPLVLTEKMDGSTLSITRDGVFASAHTHPEGHASLDMARATWSALAPRVPRQLSVFGEWMYARHSIGYERLPDYFLIFGVRDDRSGSWRSWRETEDLAGELGIPTVPVLWSGRLSQAADLERLIQTFAREPSSCGAAEREGLVVRRADAFGDADKAIAQWVRAARGPGGDYRTSRATVRNTLAR